MKKTVQPADKAEVLSPKQVAVLLGINYETVLDYIDGGELRARKIRDRYFIRREWVDDLLDGVDPNTAA